MSDDLIKREDVIAILKDLQKNHLQFCYIPFRQAIEMVEAVPSADRPQGKWIAVSAFDAFGGDEATWMAHGNPTAFHYCSECKEQARIDEFGEEILSNFCPDCGARMKGADDGNK